MRKKIQISKTYIKQIQSFVNKTESIPDDQKQTFIDEFTDHLKYEMRVLKDCSEKNIITLYIAETSVYLKKNGYCPFSEMLSKIKENTRTRLANIYASKSNDGEENVIGIYFNDIKKEYILHPVQEQDEVEFNEENREIFLKNNLKLVIDVAKRYTGLGVPFEDLIQAGNIGLCKGFSKFDKNRANLRIRVIKDIRNIQNTPIAYQDAVDIVTNNFVYSKNLDSTLKTLPKDGFETKEDFIDWANTHIKTAVFSSVAFQWIRAEIFQELTKYGKVIRIPKPSKGQQQQLQKTSTIIVNLDSVNTHTNDCYHDNQISEVSNENFLIEDQEIENGDKKVVLSTLIDKVLDKCLNSLEKRIVKKSFGIGYPYQLNSLEIAENEGLSSNKVKYLLKVSMAKITNSLTEKEQDILKNIIYS